MSVAYISLEDIDGNTYNFPPSFWISSEATTTSKNIVNRTYAVGGKNKADGFLQTKVLAINGALRADSLSALDTLKRAFSKAVLKGGKLTVSDDTVSRYIEVTAPDISFVLGYRYEYEISILFLCEDPFWRDSSYTTVSNTVTGNDTLTINATGSDYLTLPIITISNDQSSDNPGVVLVNTSDGSMRFVYNDPLFIDGDTLIINCEEGTIKKNNNDAIGNTVPPTRFLRLQPLSNSIRYEGSACTIDFSFQKVYLI